MNSLTVPELTLRSRALFQKMLVPQLPNKFLTFYGNRKFITVLTKARHLFYPEGGQSSLCPLPIVFLKTRFNLIPTSTLRSL
jgi:hypothetical protein